MSISYQHAHNTQASPEQVFTVIDDLPRTARWLPPCVQLEKIGDGPNAVGDQLRYVFREGHRESEMCGEILSRIPNKRLHCIYRDRSFDVSVDLQITASPSGTCISHHIDIAPKTFFGKLLSPLIRLGLRKQTHDAARNLQALLEGHDTSAQAGDKAVG